MRTTVTKIAATLFVGTTALIAVDAGGALASTEPTLHIANEGTITHHELFGGRTHANVLITFSCEMGVEFGLRGRIMQDQGAVSPVVQNRGTCTGVEQSVVLSAGDAGTQGGFRVGEAWASVTLSEMRDGTCVPAVSLTKAFTLAEAFTDVRPSLADVHPSLAEVRPSLSDIRPS